MALPAGLTLTHIRKAVAFIEREAAEFVDLYLEQTNLFSAVVGILGTKALDSVSPYEKVIALNQRPARDRMPLIPIMTMKAGMLSGVTSWILRNRWGSLSSFGELTVHTSERRTGVTREAPREQPEVEERILST